MSPGRTSSGEQESDAATGGWLETDPVWLRRPRREDVDRIFEVHADPRTYAHAPDQAMRVRAEAESLLGAWLTHWKAHGSGYAAVLAHGCIWLVADAQIVGFAGAKHQSVLGLDVLNLYYRFAPEAWGHGLATEAARAVRGWCEATFPARPVLARVARNNPASIAVAERIGLERSRAQDPADPVEHWCYASRPLTRR